MNRSDWAVMLRKHAIGSGDNLARAQRLIERLEDQFAPADALRLLQISMDQEREARFDMLASDSKDQAVVIVEAIRTMMTREECVSDEDETPPDYDSFEWDEDEE